jgi:predicted house-cleaning noncanonical NTP pyrophosphatase (MazG superfamily)
LRKLLYCLSIVSQNKPLPILHGIGKKQSVEKSPAVNESVRYKVLKRAKGKCELCGIPSSLRPIDIDHIIPQSKANKYGKVVRDGKPINVHDLDNLQALCFKCNRAKRDTDDTDFRRVEKLVRDKIPEIMREQGKEPVVKPLTGKALKIALREKLVEEVEEFLEGHKTEELADIIEVAFSIANLKGVSDEELLAVVNEKRESAGRFIEGYRLTL